MRALSLLSGGLDSTVATWWAMEQGWDTSAITFNYHQRPPPELEACRRMADRAGIELIEVPLPWMRELVDPPHPRLRNPALAAAAAEGYVPARNAVFYAIAAHHAELVSACRLVGGHTGSDPETFPDAAGSFFDGLAGVLSTGLVSGTELAIVQPLKDLDKEAIVRIGIELGAPLELSWSCYELGPSWCGACPSCTERAGAFEALGVQDPALALTP